MERGVTSRATVCFIIIMQTVILLASKRMRKKTRSAPAEDGCTSKTKSVYIIFPDFCSILAWTYYAAYFFGIISSRLVRITFVCLYLARTSCKAMSSSSMCVVTLLRTFLRAILPL